MASLGQGHTIKIRLNSGQELGKGLEQPAQHTHQNYGWDHTTCSYYLSSH